VGSAALLIAGAASADLLDGDFWAADDKNPRVQSETEVLFPGDDNDVSVAATCEALTGENVAFAIDAFQRPSKTTITGDKATIDKNRKEEPALVFGILPGVCSITGNTTCFFGFGDEWPLFNDCPGEETCDSVVEELDCETARVKSTVNMKSGKINWSGQAKSCFTESALLLAAVNEACKRQDGRNKGITFKFKDDEIKDLKITGKSSDAIMLP
jgi:hypothetical protein